MRLKGKGVRRRDGSRGDAYVTFRIVLPREPDPALEGFVRGWGPPGHSHDTRRES